MQHRLDFGRVPRRLALQGKDRSKTMRYAAKGLDSERARQHDVLLERAFARPGVREVMENYRHWQRLDRYVDLWRRVAAPPAMEFSKDRSV